MVTFSLILVQVHESTHPQHLDCIYIRARKYTTRDEYYIIFVIFGKLHNIVIFVPAPTQHRRSEVQ